MKVIQEKYIKKDEFFKLNRLFDVSKSEIQNDWKMYIEQRIYQLKQRRLRSKYLQDACPSQRRILKKIL